MNHLVQRLAKLSDDLDAVREAVRQTQPAKVEWPWVKRLECVQRRLDMLLADVAGLDVGGENFPP